MTVSRLQSACRTTQQIALLCLVFVIVAVNDSVSAELAVSIDPSVTAVAGGDVFDVNIIVDDSGVAFNGFDLNIGYDPTRLTYIGQPASALAGSLMTNACGSSPFHIFQVAADSTTINVNYIMLCSGVTVTGPGVIYTLRFQAKFQSGNTSLEFLTGTNFYDAGMRVSPLAIVAGSINIGFVAAVENLPSLAQVKLQVAPNPFNPSTQVLFDLPESGEINLSVFDTRGRRIKSLVSSWRESGPVNVIWDGTDQNGQRQPGGVYLFALVYGQDRQRLVSTKKVVLLP